MYKHRGGLVIVVFYFIEFSITNGFLNSINLSDTKILTSIILDDYPKVFGVISLKGFDTKPIVRTLAY